MINEKTYWAVVCLRNGKREWLIEGGADGLTYFDDLNWPARQLFSSKQLAQLARWTLISRSHDYESQLRIVRITRRRVAK